jgi:hypothetical protein
MNRRSILGFFLSSPLVGVAAVAAPSLAEAGMASIKNGLASCSDIRARVMVHISEEIHMLEEDGFTSDDIARWYSLPNHRYLEIKATLAGAHNEPEKK